MTEPHAHGAAPWHGTTILSARNEDKVVVIGDGQAAERIAEIVARAH